MRINDFDLYRDLLKEKSGLTLTPDKSYLLDSRLTPVARKWNYSDLDAMTLALRAMPPPALIKDIVEAMTTNETSFFRDSKPFDQFRDVIIPHLLKTRTQKRVRIWCAAASTGQEPYSLAMVIKENAAASTGQEPYSLAMVIKENAARLPGWNFEIIATDIDTAVLETAKAGEYSQFEVQRGLPIQMLMKYFEQKGDRWLIKNDLKTMIQYKHFNLLSPMAGLGKFDIIFCRNVLIYFDRETKAQVLENMAGLLPDDGFMVLGGAETVLGITEAFKPLENTRGIYIKPTCTGISTAAAPVAAANPVSSRGAKA